MTVVARFKLQGHMVMISDLLISNSPENAIDDVDLSTMEVDAIDFAHSRMEKKPDYVPVGMRQKIAILSDHVAIGWAGSVRQARRVLQSLTKQNDEERFDKKRLLAALDKLDGEFKFSPSTAQSEDDQLDLLGWIVDENGWHEISFGAAQNIPHGKRVTDLALIGSGEESVGESLCNSDVADKLVGDIPDQELTGMALSFAGGLMSPEVMTMFNLAEYYGGGYELVLWSDIGFVKFGNATFIFWTLRLLENGRLEVFAFPERAIRVAYNYDTLLLRKAVFNGEPSCVCKMLPVPPVTKSSSEVTLPSAPPSMNSELHVIIFTVIYQERLYDITCVPLPPTPPNFQDKVYFREDGDHVTVEYDGAFLTKKARKIHVELKRPPYNPG